MTETKQKQRVCIIGAGPSGMSLLSAFMYAQQQQQQQQQQNQEHSEMPELVCFEKQAEMGGLWNYSWRTGVDEYGESVHGSMYRYLWSNGPKECLEMADYNYDEHFKKAIPSFPPRLVLRDYLLGKAKKYGIEKFIRARHVVRNVIERKDSDSSSGGRKFAVTYEKLEERKCYTEFFDYVVVATGHFSVPNFPSFPGLDTFPGDLLHSHDFKDALKYKDRRIVVVGSSYSAEDIALQLYKYGAKEVIVSMRKATMGFKWPASITEYPLLSKIEGSTVHFSDGKSYKADSIIFCTGYQHYFPFMEEKIRLHTRNTLYPDNLYKGCIFHNCTEVFYLSMQDQCFTFPMFDAEAWFVRDCILGKLPIPSKEEREGDMKKWQTRFLSVDTQCNCANFQRDFIADLHMYIDYPKYDLNSMAEMIKQWTQDKLDDISTYREKCFKSPCTGTMGTPLYAPWLDAMDDSLENFLQ